MEGIRKYQFKKVVSLSNQTAKHTPKGDLEHHIKFEATRELANKLVEEFEHFPIQFSREEVHNPQTWDKQTFEYDFSVVIIDEQRIKQLLTREKKYLKMVGEQND